jgi:hypothetical protein
MAADRIHIAEPAPPRCSGCFQQKPQERHVDFGAAYDGPVVPAAENVAGLVGHVIDDLILCETCITEAAQLVGLGNAAALTAERDQLEAGNRELRAKNVGLEDYNAKLEAALAAKPEPRKPDNRKVAQNRQKAKA